jgi:hypothetical protein
MGRGKTVKKALGPLDIDDPNDLFNRQVDAMTRPNPEFRGGACRAASPMISGVPSKMCVFAAATLLASCGAEPSSRAANAANAVASAPSANETDSAPPGAGTGTASAIRALLPAGQQFETHIDGDLNGDGRPDVAFVGSDSKGAATLYVAFGAEDPATAQYKVVARGPLATEAPDQFDLSIERGVLVVDFEIGGTTRVDSTYSLRYDGRAKTMRLIGFDMTSYDKMLVHDTTELSWNLLTGGVVRSVAKATTSDDGPPAVEKRSKRLVAPIMLEALPAPDEIEAMIERRTL